MLIKKIKYFVTEKGTSPFEDWFEKLDKLARTIVIRTIQRVAQGGAKKSVKALKDGVFEMKIPHGPQVTECISLKMVMK